MERYYDGDQDRLFTEAHVISPHRRLDLGARPKVCHRCFQCILNKILSKFELWLIKHVSSILIHLWTLDDLSWYLWSLDKTELSPSHEDSIIMRIHKQLKYIYLPFWTIQMIIFHFLLAKEWYSYWSHSSVVTMQNASIKK